MTDEPFKNDLPPKQGRFFEFREDCRHWNTDGSYFIFEFDHWLEKVRCLRMPNTGWKKPTEFRDIKQKDIGALPYVKYYGYKLFFSNMHFTREAVEESFKKKYNIEHVIFRDIYAQQIMREEWEDERQ